MYKLFAVFLLITSIFFIALPTALAECRPFWGTPDDEDFLCSGDSPLGVYVGSGYDTVTIVGGRTSSVNSSGGVLVIHILPGAVLGSDLRESAATMIGDGHIISSGSIITAGPGIQLWGNGSITHIGNIESGVNAVVAYGQADIYIVGDVTVSDLWGILLPRDTNGSSIYHEGSLMAEYSGIELWESGTVVNIGDILVDEITGTGIWLKGDGFINQQGNITAAIGIASNGDVVMNGLITATIAGIVLGESRLDLTGSIMVSTSDGVGINGSDLGFEPQSQLVTIDGTISAPVAIVLNRGDDAVEISGTSEIHGAIYLGSGDDAIVIAPGAVIEDTIYGGEGEEVSGDTLYLGAGMYCREDRTVDPLVQSINDALAGADPNSGTITFQGRTYTYREFEQLASGMGYYTCFPQMRDGRINAYDQGAPSALYCTEDRGISVWTIDETGNGAFSFAVSGAQVASALATASTAAANQPLDGDAGNHALYALSNGHEIQFMAPDLRDTAKTYQFNFDYGVCPEATE